MVHGLSAIALPRTPRDDVAASFCFTLVKQQMHVRILGARERPSYANRPPSREGAGNAG